MTDARRRIPAVDRLLTSPEFEPLVGRAGRRHVAALLREVQDGLRDGQAAGDRDGAVPTDVAWYARAVEARLERADRPSLRRVINATGVVLHTNLGRAPLAQAARAALTGAAGYASLELDLDSGDRGSRNEHCVPLLRDLTGAEAALVVNNNAAAVVLALNTLARGGEAVISRGELVEIGGSFRVPEIMARSGARMREVGATNRTHASDYEAALGPDARAVLKVHRSNFRVEGFTSEVGIGELAALTSRADVPLIHDLGSGALISLDGAGLPPEPTAGESLAAGADVVTMSGDKLLGGPQAGIVLGRAELVAAMRANPLCRAFRCDKLTLAALHATLALYRDPDRARREIPVLRMLTVDPAELAARAATLADRFTAAGLPAETAADVSAVGGGAHPGAELPTTVVRVRPGRGGADGLAARCRTGDPAVVGRVRDGRLVLDPRTVDPSEEDDLYHAVVHAAEVTADD